MSSRVDQIVEVVTSGSQWFVDLLLSVQLPYCHLAALYMPYDFTVVQQGRERAEETYL